MFKERLFDAALANKAAEIPVAIIPKPGMRQAFAEMYEILKHCNHEVTSRVPGKFVAMLKKRMDSNWVVNLDFSKELRDMDMLVDTRVLLHWVYRDFLCSETERKKIIEEKTLEAAASGEMYPTLSLYEVMDMLG